MAFLESTTSPFDLLLTDLVMPGELNGKNLADEARRRWPVTKIILMSGYSEIVLTPDSELTAGMLLLSKPFRKIDLAKVVRQTLDQGEGNYGGNA